jgi:DNA-binding XRE family transcriptional regulator
MKNSIYLKYFWDLNDNAIRELEDIFKDPNHPKFNMRLVSLLSRCQKPKELFLFIDKNNFVEFWPKVKKYWEKTTGSTDFIDWWQTVYEQLFHKKGTGYKKSLGQPMPFLVNIGVEIKEARVKKGLSQKELALQVGMKQPDISKIEDGKTNITLITLFSLAKVLGIEAIKIK